MTNLTQILLLLALLLPPSATAALKTSDPANNKARALIARLKKEPVKGNALIAAAPLLNFSSSPALPMQNKALTWIVQFDNPFTNRDLSIEVKNNGQPVTNVQSPYKGMFVVALGLQTEARANGTLAVTLFAENPQNNIDTKNAVKALDTDIRRLTTQVNAERDPAKRRILQLQREEKLALKNELLAQLKKHKFKLGTQNHAYSVKADESSSTLPKITAISPVTGAVEGGTLLTVSGQNFSAEVAAKIGGLDSPSVTYVNETTVQAITPDFDGALGAKDLELRFTEGGEVTNVVAPGIFFAQVSPPAAPQKPVAIASGSQKLVLGAAAQLEGNQSYGSPSVTLGYAWTVASAPANSNFTPGQNVGTEPNISVTPNAVGTYVFSLVVTELDTTEMLASEPSIVVVQVEGNPQPIANPVTVAAGASATTQVLANDPTQGVAHTYAITQAPQIGTASISNDGVVTYNAPIGIAGQDSLVVRVTNQAGRSGNVTIPVTIIAFSSAPLPYADPITTNTEPGFTQVIPNDVDAEQTFTFEVVIQPANGSASVSSTGLVSTSSNPGFIGLDSVTVKVTDSGTPASSGFAKIYIFVAANAVPALSGDAIFIAEGGTGTSQMVVTNEATQSGTYSVNDPAHGSASVTQFGVVSYTADPGFGGDDSVLVSYTDNGSPGITGSYSLPVTVNGAPVVTVPSITLATGGQKTSQVAVSDPNSGQTFTYAITTEPEHGTATISTDGLVTYDSTPGYTGADSLVVTVTDNGNPVASGSVTLAITVTENHAPIASAPSIEVLAQESATSQVTASDEDQEQTLSYSISTPPQFGTAEVSASGLVTYTSTSLYDNSDSIGVTVTDNGFPNLSATISIAVVTDGLDNQPPVINGDLSFTIRTQGHPVQVQMSTAVAGQFFDPDGSIAKLEWDFGDGTQERTTDMAFANILHNYMATGTYTATLKVTDNLGAVSTKPLSVVVVDTDIPTVKARVNPSNGGGGVVPLTVTFDATEASDSNGIASYRWRFGNTATEIVTTNPVITHTFNTAGTYAVRFRTRDSHRAQGEATMNVTVGSTVTGISLQPQFMAGPPRHVVVGTTLNFDGSRSFNPNPAGIIANHLWDFTDFLCADGCTATGATTSYTYPFALNYFPGLRVQSGGGGISVRTVQEVFIVNTGFAPKGVPRATVISGPAPLTVSFDSSESYDYDGTLVNHQWYMRDGSENPAPGTQVTHTFQTANVYTPYVDITDNDGNTVSAGLTISVTNPPPLGILEKQTKKDVPYDPDREYLRQMLATSCGRGSGEACFQLAEMYTEDGDAFTAEKLKEQACTLGYQPACVKGGKL